MGVVIVMVALAGLALAGMWRGVRVGWRHGVVWGVALAGSAALGVAALAAWRGLDGVVAQWAWWRWGLLAGALLPPLVFAARRAIEDAETHAVITWITSALCLAGLLTVFSQTLRATVDARLDDARALSQRLQGTDYDAIQAVAQPPAR